MVTRVGNSDPNTLLGTNGPDILRGNGGNDTLRGGLGMDKLYGGPQNDYLYGGGGNDHEWGGAGADRFYFLGGASGKDRIYDFTDNVDTLVISRKYGFNTIQDVLDAAHPSGGDTPIDFSGDGSNQNLQLILMGYDRSIETLRNDIVLVA